MLENDGLAPLLYIWWSRTHPSITLQKGGFLSWLRPSVVPRLSQSPIPLTLIDYYYNYYLEFRICIITLY